MTRVQLISKVYGRLELNTWTRHCPNFHRQVPMMAPSGGQGKFSMLWKMKWTVTGTDPQWGSGPTPARVGHPDSTLCGDLRSLCCLQDSVPPLHAVYLASSTGRLLPPPALAPPSIPVARSSDNSYHLWAPKEPRPVLSA